MVRMYQSKTGKYKGLWHVREYFRGKYIHIGRYKSKQEAERVLKDLSE